MILTRLRIRNFRQYRGDHELRFAKPSDENVTVVEGPNGAGKSGLFLALNWCLYGEGAEIDTKGLLRNKDADGDETFAEVHFLHEGRQYIARREITVAGSKEVTGPLMLDTLTPKGKVTAVPSPTGTINSILPADARRYFFFDGERIDELSRPGHEEEVSDAVRSVLNLKVLERAVTHLESVEKSLAKDASKHKALGEREIQLIERTEDLNERLAAYREEREQGVRRLRSIQDEIGDLRERMRQGSEAREVASRQQVLEHEVELIEIDRAELLDKMSTELPRLAFAIAQDAVLAADTILDEKRSKGEIPSSLRQHLVDDLLAAGSCICDRPIDGEARDALNRRRSSAVSDELEETVQLATGRIKALIADEVDQVDMTRRMLSRRSELIDREDEAQRAIDELRGRLRTDFSEEIREIEERVRSLEDERNDLNYRRGRIDQEIVDVEEQLKELGKELAALEIGDAEAKRLRRKYEIARDAAVAARQLLDAFRTHARAEIEKETDAVFKRLIWKREHFDHVTISDTYALDVIDRFGGNALRELSAGERQVLSLAFIVAMTTVADHEAPLVIDTPFGRISREVQEHLAERLPSAAPQLVLLLTDSELNADAEKILDQYVGHKAVLDFDESTSSTSLKVVK